uniref:Uncharacterized protein n=1 Tax=Tanacetum cinerariifolium TaxID=118510 RepID=A0A699IKY0_TANCI|nr:hypothetical protein [Tanacetum cinerariifolium]
MVVGLSYCPGTLATYTAQGYLQCTYGRRAIVFRHEQYGERNYGAEVEAKEEVVPKPPPVGPTKKLGEEFSKTYTTKEWKHGFEFLELKLIVFVTNVELARVAIEKKDASIKAWEQRERSKVENTAQKKLTVIEAVEDRLLSALGGHQKGMKERGTSQAQSNRMTSSKSQSQQHERSNSSGSNHKKPPEQISNPCKVVNNVLKSQSIKTGAEPVDELRENGIHDNQYCADIIKAQKNLVLEESSSTANLNASEDTNTIGEARKVQFIGEQLGFKWVGNRESDGGKGV